MPKFKLIEASRTATQKLFRGMDWGAELEARLRKAKKDNTKNAAIRQFYMDFIQTEFSPDPADKKLLLFFKSIEPAFYEQLEKIGFSEKVNPFIRFLRYATGLDPKYPDFKLPITADGFNAVTNAYIDDLLTGTAIASLSDYNILWCRDLFKKHSGEIVAYLDLQSDMQKIAPDTKITQNIKTPAVDEDGKEILDDTGKPILQSIVLDPKSIIPRLFLEQPKVPDTVKTVDDIINYCLYRLAEDDVVLTTNPDAKLRSQSFIKECLRTRPFAKRTNTQKQQKPTDLKLQGIIDWINNLPTDKKATVVQTIFASTGFVAKPEVNTAYKKAIGRVTDRNTLLDNSTVLAIQQKILPLKLSAEDVVKLLDGIK